MTDLEIIAIIAFVVISPFCYFTLNRWTHDIAKRNRYLEAQVRLLANMAKAQGVNEDVIKDILAKAN